MRVASLSNRFATYARLMSTSLPSSSFLPATQVCSRVRVVIKDMYSLPNVRENDHFVADLGLDSLQRKAVLDRLASEFCVTIPSAQADTILSIDSASKFFTEHPKAR